MTAPAAGSGLLVRAADAETVTIAGNHARLLAEGGAFSAVRTTLEPGVQGARPHHHARATELFFVVAGCIDLLVANAVLTARPGDLAIVAPMAMHAFANASATEPADLLIVFGPGIERFDYFRLLRDVAGGAASVADLLASQERFDNWFGESAAWTAHQSRAT